MEKIIAACGNDCSACPRHLPRTEDELQHTAELWLKIGYRDRIVSNEQISCTGCKLNNWCRYNIIQCTVKNNIDNCGECKEYPCADLKECFVITDSFAPLCKKVCSKEEYEALQKAFFEKKKNLDKEKNNTPKNHEKISKNY